MTTYVIARETAEIVVILAQAAEHLGNAAASVNAGGRGQFSRDLASASASAGRAIASLLAETITAGEEEAAENSDAGA